MIAVSKTGSTVLGAEENQVGQDSHCRAAGTSQSQREGPQWLSIPFYCHLVCWLQAERNKGLFELF